MRKIIVFLFCIPGVVFCGTWDNEIETCLRSESPESLTEMECLPSGYSQADRIFQVIFDQELRKIDIIIENFIVWLSQERYSIVLDKFKQIYFWFDPISGNENNFWNQYIFACQEALTETQIYFEENEYTFSIGDDYFRQASATCLHGENNNSISILLNNKIDAYKDLAFLISVRSMYEGLALGRYDYFSGINEDYSRVIDKFYSVALYFSTFNSKWNAKTETQVSQ